MDDTIRSFALRSVAATSTHGGQPFRRGNKGNSLVRAEFSPTQQQPEFSFRSESYARSISSELMK